MFSTSDLFVNSIIPVIIVIASGVIVFIESLIKDNKFISPWLSLGTCIIGTVVLILLQATLADLLIYLVSVLLIRLVIGLIMDKRNKGKKGGNENDI